MKLIKSSHEGNKFSCDQCDYKARHKRRLLTYIQSIPEGVKFPCDQCDYKVTRKEHLLIHIMSIHDLLKHKKSSHGGVK